jgi:hypothetical protein
LFNSRVVTLDTGRRVWNVIPSSKLLPSECFSELTSFEYIDNLTYDSLFTDYLLSHSRFGTSSDSISITLKNLSAGADKENETFGGESAKDLAQDPVA